MSAVAVRQGRTATLPTAAIGAMGGLLGALAMNLYVRAVRAGRDREVPGAAPGRRRDHRGVQPPQADGRAEDDATVRVARAAAVAVTGRPPSPPVSRRLGVAVHLAFGAAAGALYAVVARRWPAAAAGAGTLYGTAVWAVANEGVLPALGVTRAPRAQPWPVHAYAIGGHWVYGAVLDAVRRGLSPRTNGAGRGRAPRGGRGRRLAGPWPVTRRSATTRALDTTPYWADAALPPFPPLDRDTHADVVVVGGGITGLTAAYLLASAGLDVVLLERHRCAGADTGHTSAHLTMVTDTRLSTLVDRFGRTHAQAVWDAGLAAIAQIETVVHTHRVDARFARVDGYLHVAPEADADTATREADRLREDARLAAEFGFDVEYVDAVPLVGGPGLRVESQARVHPRRYVAGLAQALVARGARIYELSEADDFCAEPRAVSANGHRVTCGDVVIATHNPLVGLADVTGAALFQTKLALYTSYVVAGRVPSGAVPDALWWDTGDPYGYLRVDRHADHDVVIYGGRDHKTGQAADTEACYAALEQRLRTVVPDVVLTHRWSGQVIETPDGLPYIGGNAPHQHAATGYAGNGLTFGTLAGMMIADAVTGRRNPWADLFAPGRTATGRALWEYVKENADYPFYLVRGRFAGADGRSLRAVPRGEGRIVEHQGRKVAASRDSAGMLTLRSATCTHMGCVVAWNAAERTWDCPCHGSRFAPSGDVIAGPAESPLGPVD